MLDVRGKWALLTGATRGIGYLSAIEMAKRGCNLILHSRSVEASEKVAEEVRSYGVEAKAVAAELSDPDSVEAMLKEIDSFGVNVEIVMNNAGLQIAYRTDYCKTPVSDYTISFQVCTIAPAMICYHFLPKMMEAGFGRIVNTTSGIALEPEQAGYNYGIVYNCLVYALFGMCIKEAAVIVYAYDGNAEVIPRVICGKVLYEGFLTACGRFLGGVLVHIHVLIFCIPDILVIHVGAHGVCVHAEHDYEHREEESQQDRYRRTYLTHHLAHRKHRPEGSCLYGKLPVHRI
ncbi:MAG: SDR family NAD(P)-dependent oxidoreductase [Lachnospiraceae bacterium]|nr:SDR family NAD(P)-dependent oxidoreductase [Lachnospiraceae bacterium]